MIENTTKGKGLLAVAGNPILHSKSPNIFNTLLSKQDINIFYLRLAMDNASEIYKTINFLDIRGLNITAPFKSKIIPFLDKISQDAKDIGAVNTIVKKNNSLIGYNTDHIGITESFRDYDISLKNKKCLVIGAGGAGQSAIYALVKSGAKVTVVNKYLDATKPLPSTYKSIPLEMDKVEKAVKNNVIIIYAIDSSKKGIDESWLKPSHAIFDMNYKKSFLSEIAVRKGCKLIQGGNMLIHQAIPAFNHFLNFSPEKQDVWEGFNTDTQKYKKNSIILTGFMGTGKTTVGKILAKKMGYSFIDIDCMIEKEIQMNIPEIFSKKGEAFFRKIEKEFLEKLIDKKNLVISCGGGIIIDENNRNLIKNKALAVWLYNDIKTSVERTKDNDRPLLKVDDPLKTAKKIFEDRKYFYAQVSDMLILNENKTPNNIAGTINEEINKTFPD